MVRPKVVAPTPCSYHAQVSSSAAVFACDPSCRCCTQSRLSVIGNRSSEIPSGFLLIYNNVHCSLSYIYNIIYTHLYLYVIGLTMFHLRFTTFLNRGITSNRMEMDGMPQSNGHPTLHIDATVWLYRNGNGLHPYLSAAAIFLRKIHRQDLGYNLMIVRDDVSMSLISSTPGHGPLDAHPVFFRGICVRVL